MMTMAERLVIVSLISQVPGLEYNIRGILIYLFGATHFATSYT